MLEGVIDETQSLAPGRKTALVIVAVMLAVPAVYVAASSRSQPLAQVALAQAGGGAVSLAELERVALVEPTAAHRINLSQAYLDKGMTSRAIPVLQELLASEPQNALAWNNLCVARMMQQEYSVAVSACEAGVRADGSMRLLQNNLRWAQDEKAKTVAALLEDSHAAPAARTAAFYLAEGFHHSHLGEYEEALEDWQRSLALDPRSGAAQNNIGMAQMLQLRYAEAEASFRKALVLDPGSQLARNNLAWAEQERKLSGDKKSLVR